MKPAATVYTNLDLTVPGGTDRDDDCFDLFIDRIRSGNLSVAHLEYDLLSSEMFFLIDVILKTANDARAKVDIRFALPPDDAPADDRSVLRVDLLGPKSP